MTKAPASDMFRTKFIWSVICISSTVAVLSVIAQAVSQGFSVGDLYRNMFEVASAYASNRYSGDISRTIFSRLGLSSAYISVMLGGLYFGSMEKLSGRWKVAFISFAPSVCVMLLQSSKGLLFLSGAFFYAGILVTRLYSKNYFLARKSDILIMVKLSVLVVPLVILSFLSRGLYASGNIGYVENRLKVYFISYSSGHLFAFSDWFSNYIGSSSLISYEGHGHSDGFYSLMCFFKWFGDTRQVPMGVYSEYYSYGDFLHSNIYTAFRGSITDFGLIGSMAFTFVLGIAIHGSFCFMLGSRRPWLSVALFFLTVGGIYMSYIISIFTWNVIPFSIFVLAMILLVNSTKVGKSGMACEYVPGGAKA